MGGYPGSRVSQHARTFAECVVSAEEGVCGPRICLEVQPASPIQLRHKQLSGPHGIGIRVDPVEAVTAGAAAAVPDLMLRAQLDRGGRGGL